MKGFLKPTFCGTKLQYIFKSVIGTNRLPVRHCRRQRGEKKRLDTHYHLRPEQQAEGRLGGRWGQIRGTFTHVEARERERERL